MGIPLSNISLSLLEVEYVVDALGKGWLSGTGEYVSRFEAALGEQIGRQYVIATANGTLALMLALQGLGVGPGDEVIVPALTFAAPAAAVKLVGASPIFVDVHPVSWTIDPLLVVPTERTKALIAVDILGHPADYDSLRMSLGDVPIIQDAAEAHGAKYKGVPVGAQGDVSIFSFHANKAISTGEGGCVLTDHPGLAEKMRVIANHGMTGVYWHDVVGSNYRMSNLVAAVGLGQVQRWYELIAGRMRVARWYDDLLPAHIGRRPVLTDDAVCWLYCIQSSERDAIFEAMAAMDIDVRKLWRPLPEMPPYRDGREYPVAARISSQGLLLPTWSGMTKAEVQQVVGVLAAREVA